MTHKERFALAAKLLKALQAACPAFSITHFNILFPVVDMCLRDAERNGKEIGRCCPSQAWLGQQAGRVRETANRRIQELKEWGLIDTYYRKSGDGKYNTLWYYIGARLWAILGRLGLALKTLFNRVTSKSQISNHKAIFSSLSNFKAEGIGTEITADFLEEINRRRRRQSEKLNQLNEEIFAIIRRIEERIFQDEKNQEGG